MICPWSSTWDSFPSEVFGDNPTAFLWHDWYSFTSRFLCQSPNELQLDPWGIYSPSVAARSYNEIIAKKGVFEKAIEKGMYFCMNAVCKASRDGESRDMTSLLWWYHFLREQRPHLSIAFLWRMHGELG